MKVKLNLNQKATAIVLVPFLVQILLFLLYSNCVRQVEAQAEAERHSKNLIGHANWFSTLVCTSTLSLTGYLHTRQPRYLSNYRSETAKIASELKRLRSLVQDDREQEHNVADLSVSTQQFLWQLRAIEEQSRAGHGVASDPLSSPRFIKYYSEVFRSRSKLLAAARRHELDEPTVTASRSKQTEAFIIFGIALNVAAAMILTSLFSKNIARRIRVLTDNTIRLARKQPLNPVTQGRDEIAHLDQVFHSMAEGLAAAARRERAVLDNAADVICSLDSVGRITEINQACLEAWGYEPEELIGQYYIELVSPQKQAATASALIRGEQSGEKFLFENEIVRKDRSFVIIRWSVYWSDEEQSYFCVAHDITQQKYIEELKTQFISMVSHDLRTPLTSILSFFDQMAAGAHGPSSPACTQSAAQAQRSTKRLINLVNDLLDLERLESGALPLELSIVDMRDVLDEALSSIKGFAAAAGVVVDDSMVCRSKVKVDAQRLTQVLVNMLSNAIKFSPEGSSVKITAVLKDECLKVSVIDWGRGIPGRMKGVLFDRFKQVEVSDARRGSGLGLAICKAIVEQHGGKMGVDSQLGMGSRFWFELPQQWEDERGYDDQEGMFSASVAGVTLGEPRLTLVAPQAPQAPPVQGEWSAQAQPSMQTALPAQPAAPVDSIAC